MGSRKSLWADQYKRMCSSGPSMWMKNTQQNRATSSYKRSNNLHNLNYKLLWEEIWSLKVPTKVKNLTCRACQNSLPTKTNLVKHKVIIDCLCEICKLHQEDVFHALYQCLELEELWNSIPLWNHSTLRQSTSFISIVGFMFAENRDSKPGPIQ